MSLHPAGFFYWTSLRRNPLVKTDIMATKIYTKTGDKGTTGLIGGTRVAKSHLRIEAYGTVDELNSYLGLCRDHLNDIKSREMLKEIQDRLFTIGSSLATDPAKEPRMKLPDLKEEDVIVLENEIDRMNDEITPLKSFIIPGGNIAVSHLHVARCICRRAERCCVRLDAENEEVSELVIRYLNRLSDYLFILCRFISHQLGVEELPWRPR